jgi:cytochrome P450
VTWIIIALSRHPEILQKLRMELDQVFPDGPHNSTGEQLSKMDYLGKVIKEGMRLYAVYIYMNIYIHIYIYTYLSTHLNIYV